MLVTQGYNSVKVSIFVELSGICRTESCTDDVFLLIALGFYQMEMENEVSTFLVSTCRMKTGFNVHDNSFIPLEGSSYLGSSATLIQCGSQAEFYIQPINPCIEDLDVLLSLKATWRLTQTVKSLKVLATYVM